MQQPSNGVTDGKRSCEGNLHVTKKEPQGWTLENSSLWWLSSDWFQNPGNILLMTSVPFCAGAYFGYVRPGNNLEEWVSGDDIPKNEANIKSSSSSLQSSSTTQAGRRATEREAQILASRQLGVQMASRALSIATLGTVGTFGVITGVGFYLSGCRSISEALDKTRQWTSRQTQSFDDWVGFENRDSRIHPEVLATKNMTEEQEMDYVYERLMKELQTSKSKTNNDSNDGNKS